MIKKYKRVSPSVDVIFFDGTNAKAIREYLKVGGEFGLPADETGKPAYAIMAREGVTLIPADSYIMVCEGRYIRHDKREYFEAEYEPVTG